MCKADDDENNDEAKAMNQQTPSTPSAPPVPLNGTMGEDKNSSPSDSDSAVTERVLSVVRDTEDGDTVSPTSATTTTTRRTKRDRDGTYSLRVDQSKMQHFRQNTTIKKVTATTKKKVASKALLRHGQDAPTGGMEALLPSFIGLSVLVFAVMAQMGFRGRATVAGIDLGTTNSVICIQAPSKAVGEITCVVDPTGGGSPIVPSVVSFLEPHERRVGPSSKIPSKLDPHPSHVVVGYQARQRIESHPHRTFYNAKRVLGRPSSDEAVRELAREVEFTILGGKQSDDGGDDSNHPYDDVYFRVKEDDDDNDDVRIPPQQVGSYIVHHLMQITKDFLGHGNVNSAVLAVPAKFDALQRQRTMEAFRDAGVKVARVLEEPTAAALAYGLHKKEGVEKILVYDFVSVCDVFERGMHKAVEISLCMYRMVY
jgi:hypothetical protein